MEKIKRNDRIAAMVRLLTQTPNRILPLSQFCEMFDAAKSTVSEDIAMAQKVFERFGLGQIETVTGAAGGVRYLPTRPADKTRAYLNGIAKQLSAPERILPGGYLYMADIMGCSDVMERMGEILAAPFYDPLPDFVLTVETKGIAIALMTARALGVPLVIARRNHELTEGPLVTINYMSAGRKMQTMSLAKHAVKSGQRALIIDDFMRGGGSAAGMRDLMQEFSVSVVGVGVVIASALPERKLVDHYYPLLIAHEIDDVKKHVRIGVAPWL
jgi:purine operon repressor